MRRSKRWHWYPCRQGDIQKGQAAPTKPAGRQAARQIASGSPGASAAPAPGTASRPAALSPMGDIGRHRPGRHVLAADRVITRCITRSMSVPGATIRPMPSDLERLPARVPAAAPGAGPAMLAAELLGRVRAELPAISELGEREQVLVSAWLTGLRS